MFCSQCANPLGDTEVYCPKCSKPVASFNFSGWNAPQVERISDIEPEMETVIRPRPVIIAQPPVTTPDNGTFKIVTTVSAAALLLLASYVGVQMYREEAARRDKAEQDARNAVVIAEAARKEAANTRAEAERERIDREAELEAANAERERIDREAELKAANAAAREAAERATRESRDTPSNRNLAMTNTGHVSMPLIYGHPAFHRDGRPLRAICKNGRPTYWQYDEALTCGMNNGVLIWVRR